MSGVFTWSTRRLCLIAGGFCVFMLAFALFLQYVLALAPCPLCIFQRVAVVAALVPLLIGALHNPRGVGGAVYGALALVGAGVGAFIAGRHLWLQSLPASEVPTCGPGLDYMMEVLPLSSVVSMVLSGSGECAEIDAAFLGLSIPGWTLVGFLVLSLMSIALIAASLHRRKRTATS